MATVFSHPTRQILTDCAIAALNDARDAGMPDFSAREEFVRAAGTAFDAIVEDKEDADPDGTAPEAARQGFLG